MHSLARCISQRDLYTRVARYLHPFTYLQGCYEQSETDHRLPRCFSLREHRRWMHSEYTRCFYSLQTMGVSLEHELHLHQSEFCRKLALLHRSATHAFIYPSSDAVGVATNGSTYICSYALCLRGANQSLCNGTLWMLPVRLNPIIQCNTPRLQRYKS